MHISLSVILAEDLDWRKMMTNSTFDIFKCLPDGSPVWIAAIQGLQEAKERMAYEAAISPGDYFIHSQGEGVVAKHDTDSQEWADVV
jgi:hypothetical protein